MTPAFDDATLAATSAVFNLAATALLVAGRAAIRRGHRALHRRLMLAALGASALFLAAYAGRWLLFEPHRFAGTGFVRGVYLAILFPHMAAALAVPPVALRAAYLGLRGRDADHRRLVRWGWPLWVYVSVSGVAVYAFLYHWPA